MSELVTSVLNLASKPGKDVPKVIAVRVKSTDYAVLEAQAALAGVKPGDLVRAAVQAFIEDVQRGESAVAER